MDKVQLEMIEQAKKQYKKIRPCGNKANLGQCFTRSQDKLLFWFNTEDQSTHLITRQQKNIVAS